jgi:hypothetical protein
MPPPPTLPGFGSVLVFVVFFLLVTFRFVFIAGFIMQRDDIGDRVQLAQFLVLFQEVSYLLLQVGFGFATCHPASDVEIPETLPPPLAILCKSGQERTGRRHVHMLAKIFGIGNGA